MNIVLSNIRHLQQSQGAKRSFAKVTMTTTRGWWRWKKTTIVDRIIYSDHVNQWKFLANNISIPDELMQPLYDEASRWGAFHGPR